MDNKRCVEGKVKSTSQQDTGIKVTWEEYAKIMLDLETWIKDYDTFLAIANGGIIPAGHLANWFDKKFAFMYLRHYEGKDKQAEVSFGGIFGKPEGRILLVDDVSDTGETFIKAKELLPQADTFALFIKPATKFVPDYYGRKESRWIIYPWERE